MAEYKTRRRGDFCVVRVDSEGKNIALFALDEQKIITKKR
ncbi:hypothetical protein HMPREF1870_02080 [Bacteroidales bacterium KA00344]|nr:hypothetical protein HMPREF1870_02080 [Bacteroidales bacterium KA00344]